MAEMLSKANLFSYCNQSQHHNNGVSVFPKSCGGSCSMKLKSQALRLSSSLASDFHGRGAVYQENKALPKRGNPLKFSVTAQTGLRIGKALRWWEKGLQPNMREVASAQDFVDSLMNSGDKLVVVDFFSPGCGGCKALHPKICQLAEMNPDVQFLQVNYEEHKSMCYSLNVHVLPFFRFYRGAYGRLCSFSCTNATIKKFKDALAKHTPDRCSLGPTKGLEDKELLALAANKDLSFNYTPKRQPTPAPAQEEIEVAEVACSTPNPTPAPAPAQEEIEVAEVACSTPNLPLPFPFPSAVKSVQEKEDKTLVSAGR